MNLENVKKDFASSVVVFLVALPLSLGIALASGADVMSGIVAAIIGGVVVGAISGAPLQVSGPAAGLSVMVFGLIQQFGFQTTCLIASVAGVFQMIFGALKFSRVALLITPAVIHGMLAGIGILISLGQIHVALGGKPYGTGPQNMMHILDSAKDMNKSAFILGLASFGIIVLWKKLLPKVSAKIPGSLIAVLLLTGISMVLNLDVPKVSLPEGGLALNLGWTIPEIHQISLIVFSALTLMLVASAESLLCALATDHLHSGPRANLDRELFAQGVGNFLSGGFGGLPITGVIVRSAANISSGAKSRLSAILHGVWILVFVLFGSAAIAHIPMAVLAGLLIHVGVNLVKMDHIRHLTKYKQHWIYFVTLGGVVLFGLLNGIGLGLVLAMGELLWKLAAVNIVIEKRNDEIHLTIKGALTFLAVPRISAALASIPAARKVRIDLNITQMDLSGLESIRNWRNQYVKSGGQVFKPDLDQWMK